MTAWIETVILLTDTSSTKEKKPLLALPEHLIKNTSHIVAGKAGKITLSTSHGFAGEEELSATY